jgi:putative transposase
VGGIWLYLILVIAAWSRKVVAWDVAERENPAIAAVPVSKACLRELISKGRKQQPILHSARQESRLEKLGVLSSFSRPLLSKDNPFS